MNEEIVYVPVLCKEYHVADNLAEKELPTESNYGLRLRIGLAFFAFALLGANDSGLGVLLPSLRNYYDLDRANVGWLFMSGSIGYFLTALNSGVLVRLLGHYLFLLLGTTSFLLGELVFSLKPPFIILLLVSPPLIGLGAAIIEAELNLYISKLKNSTSLLNYLYSFYGIGGLVGPVLAATILATDWDWNSIYFVWVGMSLVLLICFGFVFNWSNPSAQNDQSENHILDAFKLRVVWIAALFLFFYIGIEASLGDWSYSFLTEERHEDIILSGGVVSGYWMGLTIGCLVSAKVSEQMGNKQLIQSCLVGTIFGILLVWLMPFSVTEATGLWLTGFCLGPIFPTAIALMSKTISNNVLLSAIGFIGSLSHVGMSLFPWLAGNLAEKFGQWSLLPYVMILWAGMLLFWLAWLRSIFTSEFCRQSS